MKKILFLKKYLSFLLAVTIALLSPILISCRNTPTDNTDDSSNSSSSDANTAEIVSTESAKYTYEAMEEDLSHLAERYPELMKVSSAGRSRDGREIYYVDVGSPDAEKKIMVNAGIHGREYLTPLFLMKELEHYLISLADSYYDEYMFRIVPMINPDGVSISQSGLDSVRDDELREIIKDAYEYDKQFDHDGIYSSIDEYLVDWKANAAGVDLNRNFDIDYWHKLNTDKEHPSSQKYKGESPCSEPETQALVAITEELEGLICAISIHSQGELIYWDSGQTGELRQATVALGVAINKMNGYPLYSSFTAPDASYNDWCVLELGIPSMNIETGTGACPLPIEQFPVIWEKNRDLLYVLAEYFKQ